MKGLSSLHLKAITLQMKFHSPPGNLFCRWGTAETTASMHTNTVCNMYFPKHIANGRNFIFVLLELCVLKTVGIRRHLKLIQANSEDFTLSFG